MRELSASFFDYFYVDFNFEFCEDRRSGKSDFLNCRDLRFSRGSIIENQFERLGTRGR